MLTLRMIRNSHCSLMVVFLLGCGSGQSSSPSQKPSGQSDGSAPELLALIEELPNDKRPENNKDTLRFSQAEQWYAKNVVGRTAKLAIPFPPDAFRGHTDAHGKPRDRYIAEFLTPKQRLNLSAMGMPIEVVSQLDGEYIRLSELDEATAERLRKWPKTEPVVIAFEVSKIAVHDAGYNYWSVEIKHPRLVDPKP